MNEYAIICGETRTLEYRVKANSIEEARANFYEWELINAEYPSDEIIEDVILINEEIKE